MMTKPCPTCRATAELGILFCVLLSSSAAKVRDSWLFGRLRAGRGERGAVVGQNSIQRLIGRRVARSTP